MMRAQQSAWFSVPAPNPSARARLFCVPYAGSGASSYHPWARALTADSIEVRSVQLPGRESRLRDAAFVSMAPLVKAVVDHMEPFLDRPYGFFGHSMGALVAFELAREIGRRGLTAPGFLCVSGATAPQVAREDEPLHQLPDDEFVRQVSERYQGIPQQVLEHKELLELVLPALRADLTVMETYQFASGDPVTCGIAAFAGSSDAHVTPEKLSAWRDVTSGTFTSRFFNGDHFFLHEHRDDLIQSVRTEFSRMPDLA